MEALLRSSIAVDQADGPDYDFVICKASMIFVGIGTNFAEHYSGHRKPRSITLHDNADLTGCEGNAPIGRLGRSSTDQVAPKRRQASALRAADSGMLS